MLLRTPKNLGVDTFPDPLFHYGAPWRPFSILQAVRRCRRLASAPFAARLVFTNNPPLLENLRSQTSDDLTPVCKLEFVHCDPLKNTSLAAKGALTQRLQRRTACKIQNCRQGAPKWQTGSGKVSTPGFLGILSNFR